MRCSSMPGGIRAMLSIYRNMLVGAERNRQAAERKLTIPVLADGEPRFGEVQRRRAGPHRSRIAASLPRASVIRFGLRPSTVRWWL